MRIFSYSHHSRCAVLPGLMQGVGEQRSHWVFADVLGPQLMRNPFHPVAMGWWDCQVSWMSQDQWDRLGAAWVRLGPKSWYCISFVAAFQSISSHPFQNCYLPLNRIYIDIRIIWYIRTQDTLKYIDITKIKRHALNTHIYNVHYIAYICYTAIHYHIF